MRIGRQHAIDTLLGSCCNVRDNRVCWHDSKIRGMEGSGLMTLAAVEAKRPRAIIVVDGTNLVRRCRDCFGRSDIDYPKLFDSLVHDADLVQVHYCTAPYVRQHDEKQYAEQMGLFNHLKSLPNTLVHKGRHEETYVRCKLCKRQYRIAREKGTDVTVATLLLTAAFRKQAERLILISGDTDFVPALEIARKEGAKCEVAFVVGPEENEFAKLNQAGPLRSQCHRYMKLDAQFMDDKWFRK